MTTHIQTTALHPDGRTIEVDQDIFDFIQDLWQAGVETLFSCQGGDYFLTNDGTLYNRPYLVFEHGKEDEVKRVLNHWNAEAVLWEGDMAKGGYWEPKLWSSVRWCWEEDWHPGMKPLRKYAKGENANYSESPFLVVPKD